MIGKCKRDHTNFPFLYLYVGFSHCSAKVDMIEQKWDLRIGSEMFEDILNCTFRLDWCDISDELYRRLDTSTSTLTRVLGALPYISARQCKKSIAP